MTTAEPAEVRLTDQLGQALEDAAYECLMAMAGVETYDVSLRDHPQAWGAIEAFAAKVKAAERERCAKLCDDISERHQRSGRYVSVVADHAVRAGGQVDGADECARAIRGA